MLQWQKWDGEVSRSGMLHIGDSSWMLQLLVAEVGYYNWWQKWDFTICGRRGMLINDTSWMV